MTYHFDRASDTVTFELSKAGKLSNVVVLNRKTVACFFDITLKDADMCLGVGMTLPSASGTGMACGAAGRGTR